MSAPKTDPGLSALTRKVGSWHGIKLTLAIICKFAKKSANRPRRLTVKSRSWLVKEQK
jgi:hypothetical protein